MSEKDVKDNETEALNNAAAENADIEAGETDMATSIESVDFAVVYDDGGDSIATESAENAENTEGIATEDSVASDNANRVNETLALGATDDEQSLDQHETVQADSATSVSSQIDREIKHHRKKDAFFFKANPTFALDHVTVHNRKTGRNVLDDVSLAFHAGATHAVLVDAEDVEQHQALVATMVGMMRTTSGNVMHKSTNLADATPVDVLGHRIGFIPQRFAVRGDLDAEGNVLYVNLFGLKVSVALSKADDENQQQTDVAIVTIGDSVIKLPCSKNGIDMGGSGSNLTVQLIKGNRTRVEQSTVTGIVSGYDVFGGGATQDTDGVKDLTTGYAGGFAGLNDEGVLADDHMVYADTIRGASGLVDPFSNTKLKSVWDFNTMSDILGPVDDGNGGKAYNTYRIYRKAVANAGEARTSAQDGNKIFSQKNTADDALNTGLDRWEVKLFDVVNTYDSGAVHSGASGDAGTTWVGIKDAVTVAGGSSTKLDAYQSPAKAVLMLDVPVSDNNGGLTPEPDDGQDPCGKDGCRSVDLTVQKVWKDGNLERPQSVELKIAAHYTDGSGNTVTPQTIQCFGTDCTTVTQKNPWTVTLDSSDASSWSNTWRKVIQGLPVAFVDGQDANGKDIVRYYTYTVEETAVTYKDGDTTKTIKPAEAGYQVSVSYNTKERVAIVTNAALLPDTGGAGTMWFLMFGLLLMGAGVVWYVRDQRVQSGTVRSGSSRIRKRGAHAA